MTIPQLSPISSSQDTCGAVMNEASESAHPSRLLRLRVSVCGRSLEGKLLTQMCKLRLPRVMTNPVFKTVVLIDTPASVCEFARLRVLAKYCVMGRFLKLEPYW